MSRPQAGEYRRGFCNPVRAATRQVTRREVVAALRRTAAEQAPSADETGTRLPSVEIERLQRMLRGRAVEMAGRRPMSGDNDRDGLAPE